MRYQFFFSYARTVGDRDLIQQFFDDLEHHVQAELGSKGRTGFKDSREIQRGADWENEIVTALENSRVIVPMYCPMFFNTENCTRELHYFVERHGGFGSDNFPAIVKPVLWRPLRLGLPRQLRATQYIVGDHHLCNERGLEYVTALHKEHRKEYLEYVMALARNIVDTPKATPPNAGRRRFGEITPTFGDGPGFRDAEPAFNGGPKHVCFVFVAASPVEFGEARNPEAYREAGEADWKPYYPRDTRRVFLMVQDVIDTIGVDMTSQQIPFDDHTGEQLHVARTSGHLIVAVVDGWTLQWSHRHREMLRALDHDLGDYWCVLVPSNEEDEEARKVQGAIEESSGAAFTTVRNVRNPSTYRERIKSANEFATALIELLTNLKAAHQRRNVPRAVPGGPSRGDITWS